MRPTYQQLYDLPKAFGAEVDFVELNQANWQLDLAVLKAKVKPETKMICLNNANNPTGTLFDQEQLQQIVAIAKEADAYILVDEVYAPLTEEGTFCSIVDCYEKELPPTLCQKPTQRQAFVSVGLPPVKNSRNIFVNTEIIR